MMLQALAAYAERRINEDADFFDPDFRWEKVAWRVEISKRGTLNGLIPLKTRNGSRWELKKIRRPYTDVNEISVRSLMKAKSYFLCDTLQRIFLFDGPDALSKDPLLLARNSYFQSLIQRAIDMEVAPELLGPIIKLLRNEADLTTLRQQLGEENASPDENVVFGIEGVDPLKNPEVLSFWRREREKTYPNDGEKAVCLITGAFSDCIDTANKIKGIGSQDTILISANEAAFCSFGLEKARNSPISPRAEGLVKASLDDLISKSRKQGLVFKNVIYLHWTKEPVVHDPIDLLSGAEENAVEHLLQSVQKGEQVYGLEENAYYAASLSGNGARIIVRDWIESTVPDVNAHIAAWFRDLSIIHPDGLRFKRDFKFGNLLYGLVRAGLDELPPNLPAQIFHAALTGLRLPQTALAAALRRQQLDQENKLNPARIALIKACLIRTGKEANKMTDQLSLDSKDAAYHCGRLFAVFDRLQYLALGEVNAGVVERYYASASVTPSLVMGRLFRTGQFHLAKVGGGTETNIEKDFESLTEAIGEKFPETLDLEAQGRFALGYYHQKAEYRRRSAERKEKELAAVIAA